jgi:hypothetical protein
MFRPKLDPVTLLSEWFNLSIRGVGREPKFFFVQVPPLHAALWQRRSDPVKGLRCVAMNAKSRALDRTLRAPARRAKHEAGGTQTKKLGLRQTPSFRISPNAGSTGERRPCHTPTATTQPPRRTVKMRHCRANPLTSSALRSAIPPRSNLLNRPLITCSSNSRKARARR